MNDCSHHEQQQQQQQQADTNSDNTSSSTTTNGSFASVAAAADKRKLILHFDQHNTIQVACTLPGRRITVEEGLNNFLTSVVWGKEVDDGSWQWISHEPAMYKPANEPDAITYFKYLEKKLVSNGLDERLELKKRTCRFVYDEPGARFRDFFDLYLQGLVYDRDWLDKHGAHIEFDDQRDVEKTFYYNNNKERAASASSTFSTNSGDGEEGGGGGGGGRRGRVRLPPNTIPADDPENKSIYHLILPDFFDMIGRLQRQRRSFTVILRTMGIDSLNFLETMRSTLASGVFASVLSAPLSVNMCVGQLRRYENDRIELEMDNEVYRDDEAIYDKLCSMEGINAIRDDFAYWQRHAYECYAAKPLWLNLHDPLHHHILFDDNIRFDATDDCIVNLRLSSPHQSPDSSVNGYENVDFDSYRLFEKCCILQPDLIQLLNPLLNRDSTRNHYLQKIKRAEHHYTKILVNKDKVKIPVVRSSPNHLRQPSSPDVVVASTKTTTTTPTPTTATVVAKRAEDVEVEEEAEEEMDRRAVRKATGNGRPENDVNKGGDDNGVGAGGDGGYSAWRKVSSAAQRKRLIKVDKQLSARLEHEENELERADQKISTVCCLQ